MVVGFKGTINGFQTRGFLPRCMEEIREDLNPDGHKDVEVHFGRYIDILYQKGAWYNGDATWEWIGEVENDMAEFRGTISDLLRFQARRKLGVFYYHKQLEAENRAADIRAVFGYFEAGRFCEDPRTRYEILVLPEKLPDAGLLDAEILVFDFEHEGYEKVEGELLALRDIKI
jgi:hypothetical protein